MAYQRDNLATLNIRSTLSKGTHAIQAFSVDVLIAIFCKQNEV